MNNNFKEKEIQFLQKTEKLLTDYIRTYAKNNRDQMGVFEENRIRKLIERAIDADFEFLHDDPDTYLDLYCKDQELN